MDEKKYRLLSFKEKSALELIKDRGSIWPVELKLIYSSSFNARNALKRLVMLGFISIDTEGRFCYVDYKYLDRTEQSQLEVNRKV